MQANETCTNSINENSPSRVTGIILAGGAGQRMGGADKGWLPFHNKALIEHVSERFRPQVERIIISCNRNMDRYRQLGYQIVMDAAANYQGPLAGICAGLQLVQTEWAAIVPVDAPFLPTNLVRALISSAQSDNADACYVRNNEKMEPTFCVLKKDRLGDLQLFIDRDSKQSVRTFLESVNAAHCQFHDAFAFKNLNTPADLT